MKNRRRPVQTSLRKTRKTNLPTGMGFVGTYLKSLGPGATRPPCGNVTSWLLNMCTYVSIENEIKTPAKSPVFPRLLFISLAPPYLFQPGQPLISEKRASFLSVSSRESWGRDSWTLGPVHHLGSKVKGGSTEGNPHRIPLTFSYGIHRITLGMGVLGYRIPW